MANSYIISPEVMAKAMKDARSPSRLEKLLAVLFAVMGLEGDIYVYVYIHISLSLYVSTYICRVNPEPVAPGETPRRSICGHGTRR